MFRERGGGLQPRAPVLLRFSSEADWESRCNGQSPTNSSRAARRQPVQWRRCRYSSSGIRCLSCSKSSRMGCCFLSAASLGENRPHSQARMVGGKNPFRSAGPEAVKERENGGPGQFPVAVMENLCAPYTLIEREDCAPQKREGRSRGIENLKPAAEGGRIRHAIRIFHRWRRRFQGTAFDKVAPQRLTAGDQAVMGVGQRKHRQEGNCLFARSADTAPNRDPVMVFVMSLLLPAAMPNDRILRANGAPANDYFRASLRPIGFQLALRRGK